MRRVYIIRHGDPDFPGGRKLCLGRTDLPLSIPGRMRAAMSGAALRSAGISAVFSSPLRRAVETAGYIGRPVAADAGFAEADFGQWDGLSFDEIRRDYPELYARRGLDRSVLPPGAEPPSSCAERFSAALYRALSETAGDIAIVSHASVTNAFLGELLGLSAAEAASINLPYGSVTLLETGEPLSLIALGKVPDPRPDESLCRRFWDCAELPEHIRAHSAAVCDLACGLCLELRRSGLSLDTELVRAGALLHDIARLSPEHARLGGEWMDALGYSRIGDIIRRHMDLRFEGTVDEAAVVCIADKLLSGTKRISLAERYDGSKKKCHTAEAVNAHAARLAEALAVADKINTICGKEVIQ